MVGTTLTISGRKLMSVETEKWLFKERKKTHLLKLKVNIGRCIKSLLMCNVLHWPFVWYMRTMLMKTVHKTLYKKQNITSKSNWLFWRCILLYKAWYPSIAIGRLCWKLCFGLFKPALFHYQHQQTSWLVSHWRFLMSINAHSVILNVIIFF